MDEYEIKIVYLSLLKREPSNDEIKQYLWNEKIILENDIRNSTEYLEKLPDFFGNVTYDRVKQSIIVNNPQKKKYDGVILTNGKTGIKTSALPDDIDFSFITVKYEMDNKGTYENNIIKGWNFCKIHFFQLNYDNVIITNVTQKLDMYNCVFTTTYDLQYMNNIIAVQHDMIPTRQYPYCFVNKFKLKLLDNSIDDTCSLDIFHILEKNKDISNFRYFTTNIDNILMFSAEGIHNKIKASICVNNTYRLSSENIYHGSKSFDDKAYNRFVLTISKDSSVELKDSPVELQILSCQMSTHDFEFPIEELNRILINIYDKPIITDHKSSWHKLWNESNIEISGKHINDIIVEESKLKIFQRGITYFMFVLHSSIRDDVVVDINPLNISTIDFTGDVFWNSDMFYVPILILLKPKCAKLLLDYRFNQLNKAKNIAASYGYKGCKFPYKNDIVNYKDVYWERISALYVINTSLIAINSWNYYRVTKDADWLKTKGYKILKNSAYFFESILDDQFNLSNVYNLNNEQDTNNSVSIYMILLTFKYAIEASYEISYKLHDTWLTIVNKLEDKLKDLIKDTTLDSIITLPNNVIILENKSQIEFINSNTNELLGTEFGGISKYMLYVSQQSYTFMLKENVYMKIFSDDDLEISENTGTANYIVDKGFTNGTLVVNGNILKSYEINDNSLFGKNAFTTVNSNQITLYNILHQNENYVNGKMKLLEPLLIFSSYYSKYIFYLFPFITQDILKDNRLYYESKQYETNIFNTSLLAGLSSQNSQTDNNLENRQNNMNFFEQSIRNLLEKETSKPWGNLDDYYLILFIIVTSLAELRITGSINYQRFYIEEFGIKSKSNFILPDYWKSLNVITKSNEFKIDNII
tara:strand:+ start:911 stop:3520 length:2610 start_codon:yes stop_codon:yes gene_type:complete